MGLFVNADFRFLCQSDGAPESNPPYILKTYHGQQHEQHYRHEAQAFARLLHNPTSTEHVVKCHATFKHGETYNLVLEWVPGGDLLQYFESQRPPQTSEEIIDFWESLVRFTVGLHRIHQVILPGDRSDQYQLVHQDIKPDNILLDISAGPRTYQFSPIIADLEHSHIMHAREDTTVIPAIDRRGNQMYCAPESSHHSGFNRTGPNNITWQADIFSAGAVLSDAASWVAKGEDGREEYLRRRREELEKIEGFANSGYETAFHDGSERLPCVDAMHREIRRSLPPHDKMTARVLDIIENHMLVLPMIVYEPSFSTTNSKRKPKTREQKLWEKCRAWTNQSPPHLLTFRNCMMFYPTLRRRHAPAEGTEYGPRQAAPRFPQALMGTRTVQIPFPLSCRPLRQPK